MSSNNEYPQLLIFKNHHVPPGIICIIVNDANDGVTSGRLIVSDQFPDCGQSEKVAEKMGKIQTLSIVA